jgi:trehalose synthase
MRAIYTPAEQSGTRDATSRRVSSPIEIVQVPAHIKLDDYGGFPAFAQSVQELRSEAVLCRARMSGRRMWMVSSTAVGGGVAEMMPRVVTLLRELGIAVDWAVMRPTRPEFFAVTKKLHNMIHGIGSANDIDAADRDLYESTSRECANALAPHISPRDVVVVHDPQPLAVGAMIKRALATPAAWRCHIGLEDDPPVARAAWEWLRPYADVYDRTLFSAPGYIRDFLTGRSEIIHPTIDPLSHKNRELAPHKLAGVLVAAGFVPAPHPVLTTAFAAQAERVAPDGSARVAYDDGGIGLLYRPIVLQLSRWDRLKGYAELMAGFSALKQGHRRASATGQRRRRIDIARLVLAGPEVGAIPDDPTAGEVLADLVARYRALPAKLQQDIAIVLLPMRSAKENALMVNCLQRCASVAVQCSLREGFGLTLTEAMWKGVPVLGTRTTGLRRQIRDHLEGRLLARPDDAEEIAATLDEMLSAPRSCLAWGRNAQRRVHAQYLVFDQVRRWLELLESLTS